MHGLSHLVEGWKSLYGRSLLVSTSVSLVHLFSLLVGGGLAIAADRSTLRVLRSGHLAERRHQLSELCYLHRPVLIGLSFIMVTGVLMAAADVETFAGSALFWIKMGLIAALVINGVALAKTERKLAATLKVLDSAPEALWRRLRANTWTSLALWLLTAAAGALLTVAA